jgi:hypothetical protein
MTARSHITERATSLNIRRACLLFKMAELTFMRRGGDEMMEDDHVSFGDVGEDLDEFQPRWIKEQTSPSSNLGQCLHIRKDKVRILSGCASLLIIQGFFRDIFQS